jgi:hypothetical protein
MVEMIKEENYAIFAINIKSISELYQAILNVKNINNEII